MEQRGDSPERAPSLHAEMGLPGTGPEGNYQERKCLKGTECPAPTTVLGTQQTHNKCLLGIWLQILSKCLSNEQI